MKDIGLCYIMTKNTEVSATINNHIPHASQSQPLDTNVTALGSLSGHTEITELIT